MILQNNALAYRDIDSVFLTGGTSMVRAIQQMFHNKFSPARVKSGDNFNSVAVGLAYSYGLVEDG